MLKPPNQRVRVVSATVEDRLAGGWVGAIARCDGDDGWLAGAELLKADPRGPVWKTRLLGRDVVVKCRCLCGLGEGMKVLLRMTRGERLWRGWQWLDGHGFASARPIVLLRGKRDGRLTECVVIELLPGTTVLHHIARLCDSEDTSHARADWEADAGPMGVRQQHALAREIGRQVARLVALGRYNRDHKPSNLIVTDVDKARVAIIDTVAIRPRTILSGDRLARMLGLLAIEPLGVGCLPRQALMMRVVRACADELGRDAKGLWRAAERAVIDNGDPTPEINPLG
jgi:hypothetical protein